MTSERKFIIIQDLSVVKFELMDRPQYISLYLSKQNHTTMELQIGDTVYLKSDARTIMTINDVSHKGQGYFECVWFSQELLQVGHFHKDTLVRYNRDK